MPEDDKDNKNFEFIKEQVIQKKNKKVKKWLIQFLMTILMAILFGIVATATFCITEPKIYKYFHKDEENKTPVSIPTAVPEPTTDNSSSNTDDNKQEPEKDDKPTEGQASDDTAANEPSKVIIQKMDANLSDFVKMYDDIKGVYNRVNKSIVTISCSINEKDWFGSSVDKKMTTSGVVINNNGTQLDILTSYDRVKDAGSIKIEITDTISADAVLKGYDEDTNLAIIEVNTAEIPQSFLSYILVATLGESYTLTVGSPVLALGSPNGYPGSMDMGIITSKGSTVSITDDILDLFNTSMDSNSDSDGIIVNLNGEIIGILTRTLKEDKNENLCTAISISKVRAIIDKLIDEKPIIYCGIIAEDMTVAAKNKHDVLNGIYVNEVRAKSPAFNAGIKGGDIILSINDQNIINTNAFYSIISEYAPGTEVKIKVKRASGTSEKEIELKIVLIEKNKSDKKD